MDGTCNASKKKENGYWRWCWYDCEANEEKETL